MTVTDGYSEWEMCDFHRRGECGLEVVRPGKVQCGYGSWCPNDLREELVAVLLQRDEPSFKRQYYRDFFDIELETP